MTMRPLHRIAEWEPQWHRVGPILVALGWALVGLMIWLVAVGVVVNTKSSHQAGGLIGFAVILGIVSTIGSLVVLWRWEEAHPEPSRADLQDRIAELEHDLGMDTP